MTEHTRGRANLRTILMGSVALAFAATVSVPLPGGVSAGKAYAQSGQGQGQGQGSGHRGSGQAGHTGGGGSGTDRGSSADHGSGTATGSGRSATSPGAGGPGDTAGSGSGSTATHGHFGGSSGDESGDEGTTSDKKGPQYGGSPESRKPTAGVSGGRPVWAKEGIPEVELGRLSVARAPATVLQHAFTETTTNWATTGSTVMTLTAAGQPTLTMTVAQLYSLPADQFANVVKTYYATIVRIDSPLENLALLKDVRTTGTTVLTGVTPASSTDLAAIFLGSASDKTIPVSADTVTAINTILGLPALTAAQTAELAAKADAVREAISIGHGE